MRIDNEIIKKKIVVPKVNRTDIQTSLAIAAMKSKLITPIFVICVLASLHLLISYMYRPRTRKVLQLCID